MKIRRRVALLVVSLTLNIAGLAQTQKLSDAPRVGLDAANDTTAMPGTVVATPVIKRMPVHRFFDRTSLISMGVETTALLTDGAITQAHLGQIRTEYRNADGVQVPFQIRLTEVDPVGKLFVNHGWPGTIAGGALSLGTDLGVRYWLHRTNHHRLERIVPFAIAASNANAAWHDTRY